ncbi:MAG: hypothetical protein AAFX87_01710 [Bacteroidota bacterium]
MKPLADHNILSILLVRVLLIAFITLVLWVVFKDEAEIRITLITFMVFIGFVWLRSVYHRSFDLYFNDEYLILKRGSFQRKIPIEDVLRVKLAPSRFKIIGLSVFAYHLGFKNENSQIEVTKLYLSHLHSDLWQFQELVKEKSPRVVIENYTIG